MKRKRFFSLLALFAMAVATVVTLSPRETNAADLTNMSDTMSRNEVSQASTHEIVFTTVTSVDNTDVVRVTLPTGFDDTGFSETDFTVTDTVAGCTWTNNVYTGGSLVLESVASACAAPQADTLTVSITANMANPSTAGEYEILVETETTGGLTEDNGYISVSIVDDDTVNVTGYIDTVLSFDIDTATTDVDCNAAGGSAPVCDSHAGASDDAGYVVDLGEMTLSSVNKSGDDVTHADGLTGLVNYIWFDLSTNADGGAVVTVVSLNEELEMDTSNEIPSVARGTAVEILAGSGLYGLKFHNGGVAESQATTPTGDVFPHAECDEASNGAGYYCGVDDSTGGSPLEIFNTGGNPVDEGRMQWSVGAAPDAADATGTYTDQLTFVATGTF